MSKLINPAHLLDDDEGDTMTTGKAFNKVVTAVRQVFVKSTDQNVQPSTAKKSVPAKVQKDVESYYEDIASYVNNQYASYKMKGFKKKSATPGFGNCDEGFEVRLCSWCQKGIRDNEATFDQGIHQGCIWKRDSVKNQKRRKEDESLMATMLASGNLNDREEGFVNSLYRQEKTTEKQQDVLYRIAKQRFFI